MDRKTEEENGLSGWTIIKDLPEDWRSMASLELGSLLSIWREQAQKLRLRGAVEKFNEKLKREWAIETGIIEGLYTLDRGVTRLLIERGMEASLIVHGSTDKPAEYVIAMLNSQKDALEGLFDFVTQRRNLSTSYIKEIHAALTRHQTTVEAVDQFGSLSNVPLLRGEWKKLPNNPTRADGCLHEYSPPEHVASEMDRLLEWHQQHVYLGVAPEVEAAWLHHRFTEIHPFQDGNGRVARALASLIFIRENFFPLVIHRDIRSDYIAALELADTGDLKPLINLFAKVQKKAFLSALSLSEGVLRSTEPVKQVISAAAERLRARSGTDGKKQEKVFEIADVIKAYTRKSLADVHEEIEGALREIKESYGSRFTELSDDTAFWFQGDCIEVAKMIGYFANTRTYKHWFRLSIREERQTDIVVSFHAIGVDFVGVLGVSAFIKFRDMKGSEGVEGPYPLSEDVFQFAFNEDVGAVQTRYDEWLSGIIVAGLEQWRRQL